MGFLRTLLALSVVLDHLGGGNADHLVGGRLAVQLFYVISGFLISYVLTATDHYQGAVGKFYANRFLRLFPIYLAVAAMTLLAHALSGGAFFRFYDALPFSAELFLVLSNIFIMGQDWLMFFGIEHSALAFTGSFARSEVPLYQGLLVPQAWTLGVEMSFYLVAPFILGSPRRLLALLAASLALRGMLIATGIGLSDPWTYRFFPTELALFLIGSLSHQVLLPRYKAWVQKFKRLPELGVGILFAYCLAHFSIGINPTVRDGLAVLLFAAVMLMIEAGYWAATRSDRKHVVSGSAARQAVTGTVQALMGLILAFSFSDAAARLTSTRPSPEPFPWAEAMAFGFGALRLSSRDFWALTPRELAAAAEGVRGRARPSPPLTRARLEALMNAHPDGDDT